MKKLIILILILLLSIECVYGEWNEDTSIVNGLSDIGVVARPVVFYDSGVWKMIAVSGDMPANIYGFQWNGTTWISNSSIVTGLSNEWLYGNANCAIFNDNGTWKLVWVEQLLTEQVPRFKGYYWDGSWVADNSIVSGLFNSGYDNVVVSAFDDNGTFRLLYGIHVGWVIQWVWSESSWSQEDSMGVFGDRSACAFVDDGVVKAVTVGAKGYYKSGTTTWVEDSDISDGLTSGHHAIFKDGDTWKAVVGKSDGTFLGYLFSIPPPSIISYSNSITNNESTTINGEIDVDITFNITTDQPIITYDWHKDGVNQNNNNDELIISFASGNHTLTVNGTNANGTSNTITWNIINPNTITLEVHSSLSSTFITDIDLNGGFVDNNNNIILTPTINEENTYPLDIQNNFYEGIKLTFISSDIISSIPLTLTGLNPSQNYALYESGTFQYEFRSTSLNYFYDITTHDEISSFQLIKLSAGSGNYNDNTEDIIDDTIDGAFILIILEEELPIELIKLILEDPIKTVTTLIKNPVNWLIFLGAYIGILIGMLLLPLKVNYADILLYGTLTWIISLLLLIIGLNLSLNYIFTSTSIILGFLTYVIYGLIMSIYLSIKNELEDA